MSMILIHSFSNIEYQYCIHICMLIPVLNYAWLIAVFQAVIGRSNYLHPFRWTSLAFMFCPCQYVRPGFWVLFNNLISRKEIIWNLWNNIVEHFTQVGFEFGYCFYYDSRVMPPELTTDKLFACSFRVMALFTLAGKGGCVSVSYGYIVPFFFLPF